MTATDQIGRTLSFIMKVAAARQDATPDQLLQLRDRLVPRLREFQATGDTTLCEAILREIMGADWKPTGQFALGPGAALGHFTDEMRARGHDPNTILGAGR
ncbi:hypothetical protein ACFTWF_32530 [Rhodococcus sp. NPDC056960]|uniref:hypothetical protein n=1 Tax=Rhodococcus sp. NPDC056960 TaxID=3345982 RepID=UPI00363F9536